MGILAASRLRRSDPRSGWLIAVGGALLVTVIVFSEAKGIFHPYYVSLLAPFVAALTGAGAAQLLKGGLSSRIVGPLAVLAGVATELVVLSRYPGQLTWLAPVLGAVGVLAALALGAFAARRVRLVALAVVLAALLAAPATWAVDTLGYATNGTFPAGGPKSVNAGGPGGIGGRLGAGAGGAGGPGAGRAGFGGARGVSAGGVPLFGSGSGPVGSPHTGGGAPPGAGSGAGVGAGVHAGGPIGAPLGNDKTIGRAIAYAKSHGGGTVAVSSQSSAASAIVGDGADVAGIGGFSGRESDVSVAWLAGEVSRGGIRWVLVEGSEASGPRLPGDTRQGSKKAIAAAAKVCQKVTLGSGSVSGVGGENTLYDCQGRATALLGTQQSKS